MGSAVSQKLATVQEPAKIWKPKEVMSGGTPLTLAISEKSCVLQSSSVQKDLSKFGY